MHWEKFLRKWFEMSKNFFLDSLNFEDDIIDFSLKVGKGFALFFNFVFFFIWRDTPQWARTSSFTRFLDHTQWRTTVDKTPLGKVISPTQRPLHDNTHNTHNRETSVPPVGFEPTILAGERSQTHASDRAATGINLDIATLKYDSATSSQNIRNQTPNDAASCPRRSENSRLCENLIRHTVNL